MYTGFVVLELSADIPPSAQATNLIDLARARQLNELDRLLREYPQVKSTHLITSVSTEGFLELERKAAEKSGKSVLEHSLTSYWSLDCRMLDQGQEVDRFVKSLNQLPEVSLAYRESSVYDPLVVNATDDPHSSSQDYLDAAPTGIDARWAWTQPNGDGAGIGFIDLEQGWFTNHEDLIAKNPAIISGDNRDGLGDYKGDHGTAVLGVAVGVDNSVGIVGIAANCTSVRMVSHFEAAATGGGGTSNVPNAIAAAIAAMSAGDVLLLEVAYLASAGGGADLPVETASADLTAIKLAVANGIVVVEAGGNNNTALDDWTNSTGQKRLNRSSRHFQDSGAIMVGASVSTVPHVKQSFSNYGSRIDCYAWGENVTTCGYGDLSPEASDDKTYTAIFSGTSSASSIIAGAALILQGWYSAWAGNRLSPGMIRELLSKAATGTPQGPGTQLIGVMPNLRAIIQTLMRALTGTPVAMSKQTDEVLTALVVENEGALTVSRVKGTQNWQGPSQISMSKVFPRETHIAMCKQTDNVLTALAVNNEGAMNVSWVEGTTSWQGPSKISAAYTFRKGAPVALCKQTDDTLTALAVDISGRMNVMWVDGTGLWQGPIPVANSHPYHPDSGTHVAMCKQTEDTLAAIAIDVEGTLTVMWVDSSGVWQGPNLIGPIGKFSSGAPIAMCKQTDNVLTTLAVDKNGAMNLSWVEGTGLWQGPTEISPPVFDLHETNIAMCKQTDDILTAIAVDKEGAMTIMWVDGTGTWQGPARISNTHVFRLGAHLDICKQTDEVLTALSVGDGNAALNVSWVEGTGLWQGPLQIWP